MHIALAEVPAHLFTAIFQTENKGSKSMIHTVRWEEQI